MFSREVIYKEILYLVSGGQIEMILFWIILNILQVNRLLHIY